MRNRSLVVRAAVVLVAGAGCASIQRAWSSNKPLLVIRGKPLASYAVASTHFTPAGLHVKVGVTCHVVTLNHWCIVSDPHCRPEPITKGSEDVACPDDLVDPSVSVRTPWGAVDTATAHGNVADLAIDWKKTGVDPLSDASVAGAASGWSLSFGTAGDETSFEVPPDELTALRITIGDATDTQYDAGDAADKAVLAAQIVESGALAEGGTGTIRVVVTNQGPRPAYRVVAVTRSSLEALHGMQLSFGRIDAGAVKIRDLQVNVPAGIDDKTPLVVVDVRSLSGATANASHRYNVTTAKVNNVAVLNVACALGAPESAPGERVHVTCTVKNIGTARVFGLGYILGIGGVQVPTHGPDGMAAGASESVDLVGEVPATAPLGSELDVTVTINGSNVTAANRMMKLHVLSGEVLSSSGACAQSLTRDQYRAKRKKLQSALQAGALSQDDFDKYDAQLVSCIK